MRVTYTCSIKSTDARGRTWHIGVDLLYDCVKSVPNRPTVKYVVHGLAIGTHDTTYIWRNMQRILYFFCDRW